jgi:hypothetical protein
MLLVVCFGGRVETRHRALPSPMASPGGKEPAVFILGTIVVLALAAVSYRWYLRRGTAH